MKPEKQNKLRNKPRNRLVNIDKQLVVARGEVDRSCTKWVKEIKRYKFLIIKQIMKMKTTGNIVMKIVVMLLGERCSVHPPR